MRQIITEEDTNAMIGEIEKLNSQIEMLSMENQELAATNAHLVSATWRERELKQQLQAAHDEINNSKALIEKQRLIERQSSLIRDSINYAHRIQTAIIPSRKTIQRFLSNSNMIYLPKDTLSGDFPWFYSKIEDYYIAAVDCTGHGVPGAMLSLIGNFKLNEIVQMGKLDPSDVLNLLHSEIKKALKQDHDTEVRDGMDVALCRVNYKKGIVSFSGAHRPLLMVDDGELIEIKGDRRAIGGKPLGNKPLKPFTNHTVQLKPGQKFFMYSDGLPDQLNRDETSKFSNKRIKELIADNASLEVGEIISIINNELDAWMEGGTKQLDDILLIGFEV